MWKGLPEKIQRWLSVSLGRQQSPSCPALPVLESNRRDRHNELQESSGKGLAGQGRSNSEKEELPFQFT